MSKAHPTKSPSSSIFAKSLSRSFSVKVFESEKLKKKKGGGEQLAGSFSSCFPPPSHLRLCTYPGTPNAEIQHRLTCHFQAFKICQAGQRAVTDGVDHGALGGKSDF